MLRVSGITASAAAHGTSTVPGEAAPPSGSGPFARLAIRRLTPAPDTRAYNAYNWPAASGQRPAASGQRPAASGMTRARRPAGACTPAPSTSAGSRRPDARTGRARARRLSLLPVLALLLGALSLFAPAPAEAQTTVWSATLTVDASGTYFGCDNDDGTQDNCSTATVLTDDDFGYGGTTYSIVNLFWDSATDTLTLTVAAGGSTLSHSAAKTALGSLTLNVQGNAFAVSGSEGAGNELEFNYNPATDWTDGLEVSVSLLAPPRAPTVAPGDQRLTVSWWGETGNIFELQYKETSAPDQEDRLTGVDPALGWVNHAQRLGPNSYVMDIRKKTAVIRGPVVGNTPKGLKPGTSYDVRLRTMIGAVATPWSGISRATTSGTKPEPETTAEPTGPHPVGPSRLGSFGEQTLLTATLTVGGAAPYFGCDDTYAPLANCSAALTTNSFTHEGTANTVTRLYIDASDANVELNLEYGTGIRESTRQWQRLTLHVDGKSFPFANGNYLTNQATEWTNTGLTWTAGQQVQIRLTASPWSGVEFESTSFLPSSETGRNDLIVQEGGSATFGVKLSRVPTENVTVNLVKSALQGASGDANAATVSPATLTFTSTNWSQAQTVTVTGVQDSDGDHEHLMILAMVSSTDFHYASPDASAGVFVTVSDDGGAVQVGAWPGAGRESGTGGTSNAFITVWLSRAPTSPVSVSYRTANGTATAGSDYRAVNGTVTFAAGETRKTVQVRIRDDNVEDSGETFWLELSNPQGATIAPGYERALVEIVNDEAHLDGLSVEGAPGAGGPWAKLDLGAFAAETTEYAVTVPHGTTHARLAPVTADEDLTLRAGSGTELTRVRSGETGPAAALAVGANVLVVKTTAGTGVEKTYEVTVTRQAAAQQPEAQQQAQPQPTAPLTAAFENVPSEHDGTAFTFDLTLSETPGAGNLPVAASFKVAPGKASVSGSGTRYTVTVTPKQANAWKDVTVTLAGGRACAEAGAICTADGRSVSNTSTTTVGGPVRIRVAGAKAREGKDESLDFAVTLNRAAAHEVSVDYATEDGTAAAGADYTATSGTLVFAAGETAKTVKVPLLDDAIDDGKETMRLLLSNPQGAYLRGIHSKAKGVIRNEDPLQAMWLSRFGRMVASDAVASVTARLETPRDAGSHVTFAGQRVNFGEAEGGGGAALATVLTGLAQTFGAPNAPASDDDPGSGAGAGSFARHGLTDPWNDSTAATGARRVTGRELLLGSSFRAVLGQGAGSQWTSWGQGASVSRFSAAVPGLDLSGESATGSMGMDYERGRLLMGFAMTHSVGEGTATDEGWRYELGSTATMAMPYARLALSERISAWGLAGTGSGTLSLDLDGSVAQRYRTDLAMTLAAAGVRGDLVKPVEAGGFALALKADAFWVRTESEAVTATEFGNLSGAEGESSRVRAVLDGSRTFSFASGAALTPKLELGLRHDAGDAETGTGVEFGAGLGFADPSRGLDMALKVHGLAVHAQDGYDEWGVSGQLRLVPGGNAGRGLSASLTPSWGVDPSGSERLWAEPASSGLAAANGGAEPSSRLDGEVGYGMALLGDRFTGTPNVGFGMSEAAREYRMGWRLTSAVRGDPGLEVSLDATRREAANDNDAEHGVMLRSLFRW